MPALARVSETLPWSAAPASALRGLAQAWSMRRSMTGHRNERVLEVSTRHLQVSDGHSALKKVAQHHLGLVGQQLDHMVRDGYGGYGKAVEILFRKGRRDETYAPSSHLGFDLSRRSIRDDHAAIDHDHAFGQLISLLQVVSREHDSPFHAGELRDSLDERAATFDVHAHGGLVKKQDVRVTTHGEGEVQALPLPARELLHEGIRFLLETGHGDRPVTRERLWIVRAEQVDDLPHLEHGRDA